MKFLKFISMRNEDSTARGFRMNYTYVISNSRNEIIKADYKIAKSILVILSGRDTASDDNYKHEAALFEIANEFLIRKIRAKKEINEKEEVGLDDLLQWNIGTEALRGFHTEIMEIEE